MQTHACAHTSTPSEYGVVLICSRCSLFSLYHTPVSQSQAAAFGKTIMHLSKAFSSSFFMLQHCIEHMLKNYIMASFESLKVVKTCSIWWKGMHLLSLLKCVHFQSNTWHQSISSTLQQYWFTASIIALFYLIHLNSKNRNLSQSFDCGFKVIIKVMI